jgi:hypothetical protein
MGETLKERLVEVLEGGGGEAAAAAAPGERFLPLVTLESEMRIGLDREAHWVAAPPDGRAPFRVEPGGEHALYEVLESKRGDFEAKLEAAAREHGLPADEVVLAFPAVDVVRGVIAKGLPYMTRLALLWILPSELRELRADVVKIAGANEMPAPIRDLASRLIVPE